MHACMFCSFLMHHTLRASLAKHFVEGIPGPGRHKLLTAEGKGSQSMAEDCSNQCPEWHLLPLGPQAHTLP